ncbi:hypothetical protein CARUB_v10007423mg [Capsella rubella]|uniref:F-box associated beta-propeller type 1 domain-containing protein n=1 Tax=Capsella rubella TaxID=81985 RepID=R0F9X1_9BRAS|nr:hypothetical protein CARUB_v10007423mg [Capsella rubella]
MATMMISDLPKDLIEEILSRTMMISVMPHKLYLTGVGVDDVDPSVEVKGQLTFLYKQVNIREVMHFEGLLLCILKDTTRVVVWNPYLRQTRWIKLRYSDHPYNISYAVGYEDKESGRRTVKLFRFLHNFNRFSHRFNSISAMQFFGYEIYDFDSGLWTSFNVDPYWGVRCCGNGVSLKGNTYWCAIEIDSIDFIKHIICFDFKRERFGPLLPLPCGARFPSVTLSCIKNEKLAALYAKYASDDYEFDIWITTKIEVEMVSWSKFLRIDASPNIVFPRTFFVDEKKKVFMGFDHRDYANTYIIINGEAKYIRKLDLEIPPPEGLYFREPLCSYVPSSVQIKNLTRGKRIEKCRFAKNRL